MATNSAKQAYYAAGELGSKMFFGNLTRCIEIAIKGGT
jgi:predicted aconitase